MFLLKFVFFSSMEYLSVLIFILTQFRFTIRENIAKITLISILLSFVSFSLIGADLRGISPLVQNAIFFIYIWIVLKVSLLNSIVMVLTGYTVYGLVQTCVVAIHAQLGMTSGVFLIGDEIGHQVQVISSSIMLLLSICTSYLNGGFSFVENRGKMNQKKLSRRYIFYIIYILFAFIVTIFTNLYLLTSDNPSYILGASTLIVILIVLFYMSFRRDESVD
jgi:hypothetical protein